ncbi:hypothetical protein ABK040_005349 [Willaertia magna]
MTSIIENYNDLPVIINGAGLVGCLAALYMIKHHQQKVVLIEKRQDYRKTNYEGRSINLAISHRAIKAIEEIDKDLVTTLKNEIGLKMIGRGLHYKKNHTSKETLQNILIQPYATDVEKDHLLSVGRQSLNILLLNYLEENFKDLIEIYFDCKPLQLNVNSETPSLLFEKENGEKVNLKSKFIIGTDGVNSFIRNSLQNNPSCKLNFSQTFISHAYKELCIKKDKVTNNHQMRNDCLHIWPRGDFMLIALPNPTRDFTVTLFMRHTKLDEPKEQQVALEKILLKLKDNKDLLSEEEEKIISNALSINPSFESVEAYGIKKWFKQEFPDAYEMIHDEDENELENQWNNNPTSVLNYVQCSPHHYDGKVILLGDAAHAIIPFYGQGVNCGFEDCRIFSELLRKEQNLMNLKKEELPQVVLQRAFSQYSQIRKRATDAILNLSLDNFIVMRQKTADFWFLLEQRIIYYLYKLFPSFEIFKPLYTMVAFTPEKTYADAWDIHVKREKWFGKIGRALKTSVWLGVLGGLSIVGVKYLLPNAHKFLKK